MTTRTLLLGIAVSLTISELASPAQAEEKKAAPAAAPVVSPVPPPAATPHIMLAPKEIQWVDAPPALPPGAKGAIIEGDPKAAGAFTMRLKIPNGYTISPHFHPGDEHVTVIKGAFHMGMGDVVDKKAAKALPVGSFMVMPKGTHHYGFARGETIVQVHGIGPWGLTYVNPADDPRSKPPTPAKGK